MTINLAELERALADDEIVPHFQPIVELRTGRLSGFEVLARWMHPLRGAILPANLIALAETHGLITEVARQAFSKAFSLLAEVPEQLRLSVNLSPIQLVDPDLARQMEAIASVSCFPMDRLTIEITESALLSDLTRAKTVAHELKEIGCRLSLDDFGTGYSSLAHLHALPFDELKIDRCFVNKMTERRESRKIVAAIIGLAHSLGLRTVAESIETEEQADMLLWLGSELGQGWHYGRPASFQATRAMVAAPPRPAASGLPTPGEDWAVSSLEAFPTQRLAQLQAIYDGAPVGLCFLDRNLRYVSLNRRLAEMNGAPVAAHMGNLVREMAPELYPNVEPLLLRALAGEAITGFEVERPGHGAAESKWLLVSYQPAFDEADDVIGVSISVMDITEHKRAQAELQEVEFAQRQLVELNRQVPWTMDPQGRDLQMSSKWVQAVTNTPQIRNLGWLEALHPDDLKPAIRKMKHALRTGERIDMEYRVQDNTGKWRWMRSRGLPRMGTDGRIARWYGSIEDIHDRKTAELAALETEITMLSLLKTVPVAIIIEQGKTRALHLDDAPVTQPASVPLAEDVTIEDVLPLMERIQDHLFQEVSRKAGVRTAMPQAQLREKRKGIAFGLQVVHDLDQAAAERRQLVTMLEEFAQHRRQN